MVRFGVISPPVHEGIKLRGPVPAASRGCTSILQSCRSAPVRSRRVTICWRPRDMLAAAGDRAAGVGCEPAEAPRNLQSEADLDGHRQEHGLLGGVLVVSRLAANDGGAIRRVPAPGLLVKPTEFL